MRELAQSCLTLALLAAATEIGCRAAPAAEADAPPAPARLRVIVETDAGGDPDDEQSLVRFLVYANEFDVEGILANRAEARAGENESPVRDGLGIVRRLLDAYGEVRPSLAGHDPAFPTKQTLWDRTVPGYAESDEAVELIIAAADRDDPRPVWFLNWGTDRGSALSSLKRALDRVLAERGPAGYAQFKNRFLLSSDDRFGEHTTRIEAAWRLWVQPKLPEMDGGRWYHRFGPLTARAGGFDLRRDVLTEHGPLGELYPTNTNIPQKEGDSLLFLYLVPTGMNDPLRPEWGSWAGRFGVREDLRPRRPTYYWANRRDSWGGKVHRDNTLKRWAADLQNDFRARMDWCVKPFGEANQRPVAALGGDLGRGILTISAEPGAAVDLSSEGSSDPDGDALSYEWVVYSEAGDYEGDAPLERAAADRARLAVPADAAGREIHVILTVRDDGDPPLAAYRRAVVCVTGR